MVEGVEKVVWRWKGTRADIVRLAGVVAAQTGPGQPFVAEIVDDMTREAFPTVQHLEAALRDRESFRSLAIVSGVEGGPCRLAVVFADSGVANAAVTVMATGTDPQAVARAHATAWRVAAAGEREPKGIEPEKVQAASAFGGLALIVFGILIGYSGAQEGEADLAALGTVMAGVGAFGAWLWLGYDALIPQIELLRPGATPRINRFALWLAGVVGALVVAAVLGVN